MPAALSPRPLSAVPTRPEPGKDLSLWTDAVSETPGAGLL